MRLSTHLVAVGLAALVPVLGFSAFVMRENAQLQLEATERGMRDTAQAVARTVDKQLESAITTLQALAESEHLDPLTLEPFHAMCRRVVPSQGWADLLLFDADGHALMQASLPLATPIQPSRRPELLAEAQSTRRPVVSDLFDGALRKNIVAVYVPVVRGDTVPYVLSAALPASDFGELLRAQGFAPGWVAAIQDRQQVILARTQREAELVGQRVPNPTPGREGWRRGRLREGTEVYVAFVTAPVSGWRIVLTAPVAMVEGPWWRGVWQMVAGTALALVLAGALAFMVGRRIADAVGALVPIARAVERGDPAEPLRTGVSEVNAIAQQLSAAAGLARARELESAVREHQARAIARVAHALNASGGLDTVLRTAVEAVRGLVAADSARIALVDDMGRLVLRFSTDVSTAMPPGFVIERGHGLGGVAWQSGRPVRTEDFAADPRFREDRYLPIARADGVVSAMAVPVVTAGTVVVGVIYANRRTRQPFTAADEAALMTLADHAAVAVQQATLLAREHAARADAEAASRGKDELLAMLGHELRNPLSAISNAMHVLSAPGASEDARLHARDIITRQNAHLAHLVDDLLDVARVTSGKIALARRPLELAGAVRQSVATLTASGRTGEHDLRLDLEAVWGNVDETRFEQIVTNLLGNALRFTPDGGRVHISLRGRPGEAVLSVRDSGVGITPDMLPRVFDLFVQGERGADRGGGGLGLGLALVRRIAELHGGGVEARSDGPGRGSEFIVRLPAIPAPPVAAREPGPAEGNGAPRRILVVEDNEDSREMLRHLLMLDGHQVYEAADGPAGLEAAVRLRPDIAFVDVGLPGLDGYAVARQVRAETGAAIRLVALTGYGQPEDRRLALEAGFDAHIVKPVAPESLLDAIRSLPEVPTS
jgi:signal transduction histidine kinase/CheY-like chemotaxis protein